MYNIYIHNIYIYIYIYIIYKVKIILFADDTNLIFKSDNTIDREHIM